MRTVAAVALLLALVAASAAAVGLRWAWHELNEPPGSTAQEERIIVIEPGESGRQIIERLADRGLLRRPLLARLYLRFGLTGRSLKAGEYRLHTGMAPVTVLRQLIEARVVTYPVTVIEGSTLEETAEQLAASGFGEHARFLDAMRSPALVADLDPEASDLEGYLYPDTYAFARGTNEDEIVQAMVSQARRHITSSILPMIDAGQSGRRSARLRDVIILASIVEKEALLDQERPIIAGVYSNRLERGIGLYADPTVVYALKQAGTWDGNIRRADLKIDSPYNTYVHRGLPPGPIASPRLASMKAAAQPAEVPFLYFVSRNDGTHAFAETLAEHNRNVYLWQKKFWRDRWAEERREQAGSN